MGPIARSTHALLLLPLAAVAIAAAVGCVVWEDAEGDDDSPTPQCTPPTQNDVDATLSLSDADAFAGHPVTARFLLPLAGPLIFSCTSAMVPAGGDVELLLDAGGVLGGAVIELLLSSDADPAYGAGDLTQVFRLDTDGTVTPDAPCSVHETWDLSFSAIGASSEAVTWELGVGCPGKT